MAAPYETQQPYPPQQYPAAGAPAPVAAPVHAPVAEHAPAVGGTKSTGPINDNDINDWKDRFNKTFANVGETVNAKSPEGAQEFSNAFFGCCSPIETCCLTYCCPCITFGKIHHRTRKSGSMEGYEPINTSCLLFLASMCVGLHWIPESMQRSDIRHKYNLQGSCITDIAIACCCALCDLVQQEKETESREKLVASQQYTNADSMVYGKQG